MRRSRHISHNRSYRRGLSLPEVVVSTLLVGLVCVAAMRCCGQVVRAQMHSADLARARHLARLLTTEIISGAYQDEGSSPVFGIESGEATGDRSAFDDVDDYHGWSDTPPQDRYGNDLPNMGDWQRDVTVELVDPDTPKDTSLGDQGLKRVTVTVQRNGQVVAKQVSLRSDKYTVQ